VDVAGGKNNPVRPKNEHPGIINAAHLEGICDFPDFVFKQCDASFRISELRFWKITGGSEQ
jgi:hypothetical protein